MEKEILAEYYDLLLLYKTNNFYSNIQESQAQL